MRHTEMYYGYKPADKHTEYKEERRILIWPKQPSCPLHFPYPLIHPHTLIKTIHSHHICFRGRHKQESHGTEKLRDSEAGRSYWTQLS